jgi:hypothetical protein
MAKLSRSRDAIFAREFCKSRHVKREDRLDNDNKGWRLAVSVRCGRLGITKPSQERRKRNADKR